MNTPADVKSDLETRIRIAERREERFISVDLPDLKVLLAPPEPLELWLVASGAGYWIFLGKKLLWHDYSDESNLMGLLQLVLNTLLQADVPYTPYETEDVRKVDNLWPRLDAVEERTGTPALDVLEFMLKRGRF